MKSTEIISAISNIYWAIYVIHLEKDTYYKVFEEGTGVILCSTNAG